MLRSSRFESECELTQDQKPKQLDSAASLASVATLGGLEENLSAYFEPFGAALAPASPGTRDSIASNDSDTVQLLPKDSNQDEVSLGLTLCFMLVV